MLAFVAELRGSLSTGELHETIARKLPSILGVDQLWIETNIGGRRKMIASADYGRRILAAPVDGSGRRMGDAFRCARVTRSSA